MDPADFRRHGNALVDWIADYLADAERYPVLPRVEPGDVRRALPTEAPEQGELFETIIADFDRVLVPALTHWNHPGFFGYFAITASAPGVLAEFLAAALNQQAMLWRTSPAATELEEVSLGWLRSLMGLPDAFEGVIYDTASISTLHALAAAREASVPEVRELGLAGRPEVGAVRIYCSEHAHSSVDKAVILLGLGHRAVRKISVDDQFRMQATALSEAIQDDRAAGILPIAVVATVGTTSTTSIDPVRETAEICHREGLWLHVDAAYAGVTAMVPEYRSRFDGWEDADSIVVNPHKWLFTPFDLSAFYCRRMDVVRQAFSLVAEYLKTRETAPVRNLMDTGIQLGRRFRALKLWFILRSFGRRKVSEVIRTHIRWAKELGEEIARDDRFEVSAPVNMSVVCFRHKGGDGANRKIVERVNAGGVAFLCGHMLNGSFGIRIAIGNLGTSREDVWQVWSAVREAAL
jgi:aromatic-L-amino-acid decarboxylase